MSFLSVHDTISLLGHEQCWYLLILYQNLPNTELILIMQNWISVSVKIKILVQYDQCRKLSVNTILNQFLANLTDNAKF